VKSLNDNGLRDATARTTQTYLVSSNYDLVFLLYSANQTGNVFISAATTSDEATEVAGICEDGGALHQIWYHGFFDILLLEQLMMQRWGRNEGISFDYALGQAFKVHSRDCGYACSFDGDYASNSSYFGSRGTSISHLSHEQVVVCDCVRGNWMQDQCQKAI
jgi:hypothetical protein